MHQPYFSDRERGPRPRVREEITEAAWGGIVAVVNARIADGSFGYRYPEQCPDGEGICGCNARMFTLDMRANIPEIVLPLDPNVLPPTMAALDLLEFCHRAVGRPNQVGYHSYYRHHHLVFEAEEGQAGFREDVNRILARNELAYELGADALIVRLAPEGLREALASAVFGTGEAELDRLLEEARTRFLDPDPKVRRDSLEMLWDAWERLKTTEPGRDKKASSAALLDRAAPEPNFRKALESEAQELTRIGNTFRIRHSETQQVLLQLDEHVDYLFHRLFGLVRLLLRVTGRGG